MSVEVSVIIKGDGRTNKREFVEYEAITLDPHNPMNHPIIARCVKESIEEFKGEADDIKIRTLMVLK